MPAGRGVRSVLLAFTLMAPVLGCGEGPGIAPGAPEARFAELLAGEPATWALEGGRLTSPGWRSGRLGDRVELGVRLPARADEALAVGLGQSEEHTLRLEPEGARPAPVTLEGGRAVYRAAFAATDAIVLATPQRVETFYLLTGAAAPTTFRYRVHVPPALPGTTVEPSGALVFTDRGGAGRLRIPRPWALDARGTWRDAELTYAGGLLTVRLDPAGLAYPILLDPAVETVYWQQKSPTHSPPVRFWHAMVFDSARNVSLLYGGLDWTTSTTTFYNDTWVYNGTDWSEATSGNPGYRYSHAMAFDSARNVAVCHGGLSTSPVSTSGSCATTTCYNDTWEWNGTAWTNRHQVAPKDPSCTTASGCTENTQLREHAMAYDSGHGRTVMYGGIDSAWYPKTWTWEWNGTTWSWIINGTIREMHAMVYNVAAGLTQSVDGWNWSDTGETLIYNGTEWDMMMMAMGPRVFTSAAYDSNRKRVVVFGGSRTKTGDSSDPPIITGYLGDTWELNGTTWSQVATTGPGARDRSAMAYDSNRRRIVLFGGQTGGSQGPGWSGAVEPTAVFNDTWEYYTHGGPCAADPDCDTGHCVDGVCCESAACGTCQACNLASPGTCTAVTNADDDTCTGASSCDATGSCKLKNGQTCTAACASGNCADGVCCDTPCLGACNTCSYPSHVGTCQLVPARVDGSPTCSPYLCTGADPGCPTACTVDLDCATGNMCDGNVCRPQGALGAACSADRACLSGHCAGGVCCLTVCAGACHTCDHPGSVGTCQLVPAGTDGSPSCIAYLCDGSHSTCPGGCAGDADCQSGYFCAAGGTCQPRKAQGACNLTLDCHVAGCRECASAGGCVDGYCCDTACAGGCDACNLSGHEGTCTNVPAGGAVCGAYVCSGTSSTCPTSCTDSGQCAAGSYCTGGVCFTRGSTGASCTQPSECLSNKCVDGVCCQSDCNLPCDVCNGAAAPGVCVPAAAGYAGAPGCAPYLCNGTATTCPTSCTSDGDCVTGLHCLFGACLGLQPKGSICSSNTACASGNCYDGVCCDVRCDGACTVCNLPGHVGTCSPADVGTDPRVQCPGVGVCKATCGAGGLCAYPDATTRCGEAARCTSLSVLHRGSSCDGHGSCVDQGTQDCSPYLCASPLCPASCVDDNGCAPGAFCSNGSCGAQLAAGAPCTRYAECASGYCVDGLCCASACDGRCQRCDRPAPGSATVDGTCRVPVGEDPDHDCKGDGVCAGTCQSDQSCAYAGPETRCDTCKACNRAGACSELPTSGDDDACGTIACGGLSTECQTFGELTQNRCHSAGLCAWPNDPAACVDHTDQPDNTPCTGGVCIAGECRLGADGGGAGDAAGDAGATPAASKSCGCHAAAAPAAPLLGLLALLLPRRRRRR